jgi:hypothetical protein
VIRIQIFIRRGSFDLNSQRLFLNLDIWQTLSCQSIKICDFHHFHWHQIVAFQRRSAESSHFDQFSHSTSKIPKFASWTLLI